YAHFPNKHALLASGIEHVLHASPSRQAATNLGPCLKLVWFSLPFFEYVGQCRHTTILKTSGRGRAVVHGHLRKLLIDRVTHEIKTTALSLKNDAPAIPADRSDVVEHDHRRRQRSTASARVYLNAISAGRSVTNTPKPTFTRLPYDDFSDSGTIPADSPAPTPGLRLFQLEK